MVASARKRNVDGNAMKLTAAQVRWFRLRRSGLVEPFSSPEETARRLVGVQAQLLPAADLAFWNRTSNCTADALTSARLEARTLIRLWGQRDTLHIFHPSDWPMLHTAFAKRQLAVHKRLERAGVSSEFRRLVRRTEKRLGNGKPLTYKAVDSSNHIRP